MFRSALAGCFSQLTAARRKDSNEVTDGRAQELIEEQAALYALGALTQHEARACEARLAGGEPAFAAAAQSFAQVVAALGYAAPEATPRPDLRAQLLDQIAVTKPAPQFAATRYAEINWKEIQPGVWGKLLYKDPLAGTRTTLYKLAPGTVFTEHRHTGSEQCFILEGDFIVNGERFGPGDFHCALPGSKHELITTTQGTVLLVVAPDEYRLCG
jgi:anti-sigma factor ChrR (cupin superfamily)